MAEEDISARLLNLGFTESSVKQTVKNKKTASALVSLLDEADIKSPCDIDPAATPLLAYLATSSSSIPAQHRTFAVRAIKSGSLKTNFQIEAAVKYLKDSIGDAAGEVDQAAFDKECGVGVSFTPEQVIEKVDTYVDSRKSEITTERYKLLPSTIAALKTDTDLKWAPPLDVKKAVDSKFLALLGPKDERDAPVKKAKTKPESKTKEELSKSTHTPADSPLSTTTMFQEGWLAALHKPGGNTQIKPELRDQHLKATGGRVFTRFPPEPNGYLHIGHSKAIAVNFGYARYHGGECYLRYDDTNPEAEEEKYFIAIKELVEWLGFTPFKITYSSDNFQKLYDLAEDLIKRDKGYICHCTAEEIFDQRGGAEHKERYECPHRNRPIEESLSEFRAMKDGKYKPKEALLRMKQDLTSGNPQMWDLTAYRILETPHHRTDDKWRIYPTYDFTHCLCDSFENISHSLCTTEFRTSRESYDWLCNVLEIYRPQQNEYGRLNLTGTIMSKRKIAKLVTGGHVRNWDDPRLFTLVAIRRRGVPPGAILSFVNELGVTESHTNIMIKKFENSVRRYLEETVPRLMLVLDPVLVIIDNLPDDHLEEFSVPFKPNDPRMGEHNVPFTKKLYIDRSDFREEDSSDYFRLAPGKSVGLFKAPNPIHVTSFKKDEKTGLITEIHAHYEKDVPFKKPKTYIQWVADAPAKSSPVKLEARIFNQLFKSENPESNPDGFLADVVPDSQEIYENAMVEVGFNEVRKRAPWPAREGEHNGEEVGPESVRFQALRVAYFAMDSDTTKDKIVLNRIVSLKEDTGKSA